MPRSSGGGSHSGGSHSSSSHHSSGRSYNNSNGGKSHKNSSTYFEGAKRYVYYSHKKPEFIYANYDIKAETNSEDKSLLISFSFFYILFLAAALFLVLKVNMHSPKKLESDYDTKIIIMDDAQVIDNPIALEESFKRFFLETGISPAVKTTSHDQWAEKYKNLEEYALDLYLDLFDDEKHWLIVYSKDPDLSDNFDNWKWEGMQGDDTVKILTKKECDFFNGQFQKYLLKKNEYSVGQALVQAFDELTPLAMEKYLPLQAYFAILIFSIVISTIFLPFFLCFSSEYKRDKKFKTALECPENFVDQENCLYCQGIYIKGLHKQCPHCGADITS